MRKLLLALLIVMGMALQSWGAITHTATVNGNNGAGSTSVATSSRSWTAGSFIAITLVINSTTPLPTCSLTSNTVRTPAGNLVTQSTTMATRVFYVYNVTAVTATVSCSWTGTQKAAVVASEFAGVDAAADPFDRIASSSSASGSNPTCGTTASTNVPNELVYGGLGAATVTPTAGSGFVIETNGTATATSGPIVAMEDKTVSAVGTQNATYTAASANQYACITATFKQALTATPAATGAVNPGTGADDSTDTGCTTGTGAWTNPTNIQTSGSPYASETATRTVKTTHCLLGKNYGFNVASTATITGIAVSIRGVGTVGDGAGNGCCTVTTNTVSLTKTGALVGNNRDSTSDWGFDGVSWLVFSYGGSNDLWGTTWAPADVNASTFGVDLIVVTDGGSVLGDGASATVDYMQITVYYINTTAGRRAQTIIAGRDPVVGFTPDGYPIYAQTRTSWVGR